RRAGAIDGVLSIMVGGEPADFSEAKDVLEAVGKTIVLVGPSGSGQTVKAANQLIVAPTSRRCPRPWSSWRPTAWTPTRRCRCSGGGLAGSKVLDQKGQKILDREFGPGFRLALHNKDMGIVTSAAREAGVILPLGAWWPSWSAPPWPAATARWTTPGSSAAYSACRASPSSHPGREHRPGPKIPVTGSADRTQRSWEPQPSCSRGAGSKRHQ
ncbi:NAD-binding protein, partial [Arthrobacter sp. JCM 19049]|uniref:NAD-binding protein n=1 Tax=Arthrobacter sp. JCM 19049 TaxID=1460643 RepID=UPI000A7A7AA7